MTTLRVATLAVALLLLLPLGHASTAATFVDEDGDESARPFDTTTDEFVEVHVGDCKSSAADVRAVNVAHDGTTLTLRLDVASLGSLEYACNAFVRLPSEADRGFYTVTLTESTEELTDLEFTDLDATAETTGFGLEGCIRIGTADAASLGCLGSFAQDGDALVWTIPLAGTATFEVFDDGTGFVTHDELRSYSLTGTPYNVRGSASVEDDAAPLLQGGGLQIQDSVRSEEPFTP